MAELYSTGSAANRCYAQAKRAYHGRCQDALLNVYNHHSWWRTLKESVLGVSPSIPPLLGPGSGLVTGREERAELFSSHFDGKQSREDIMLPLACHVIPSFCSIAFRSKEVKNLLLDLDSYGGCDPQGFFLSFFKKIARKLTPRLSVVLRDLVNRGCFPETWRQEDVVPIYDLFFCRIQSNFHHAGSVQGI